MGGDDKTEWDVYYEKPYLTSKVSRYFSTRKLIRNIKQYASPQKSLTIAELGGAGSAFYSKINTICKPVRYYIFDNNQFGLDILSQNPEKNNLILRNVDILLLDEKLGLDIVYSIGVIEHFTGDDTHRAIKAHFDLLRSGGIAIISFPTPTWLYRLSRTISTLLGLWIWHDEVPLSVETVVELAVKYGEIVDVKTLWPMFLTHAMLVIRKS
jgi:SAM-dependent methyltransferase